MAIIANTYKTYESKGIREELSDVIYNISPTETPFMSNCGQGQGQQHLLRVAAGCARRVDAANAQLEGDDIAAFPAVADEPRIGNYAQISRKLLITAGTRGSSRQGWSQE
jgi:hypothetical protein